MSYSTIDQLQADNLFTGRNRACCQEQAESFRNDQRPAFVSLADAIIKDEGGYHHTFTRMAAAGPGIADKADNGDGTIDQTKVTDQDLLSLTQANWPIVAGLYFNEDGSPIE